MAGEEKTEQATPKKRRDARKEGDVLQSKEIGTAVSVLGIFDIFVNFPTALIDISVCVRYNNIL